MNILAKNKGVIIFYISLLVFMFLCSWRFERLENNANQSNQENKSIVLYVK